jgi:hypothetical protein
MPTHCALVACHASQEKGFKFVTYHMIRDLGQEGCNFLADDFLGWPSKNCCPRPAQCREWTEATEEQRTRAGSHTCAGAGNFFGKQPNNETPWHKDIVTGVECYADTTFSVSVPVHAVVVGCVSAHLHICSCTHVHKSPTNKKADCGVICVCAAGGLLAAGSAGWWPSGRWTLPPRSRRCLGWSRGLSHRGLSHHLHGRAGNNGTFSFEFCDGGGGMSPGAQWFHEYAITGDKTDKKTGTGSRRVPPECTRVHTRHHRVGAGQELSAWPASRCRTTGTRRSCTRAASRGRGGRRRLRATSRHPRRRNAPIDLNHEP